MPDQAPNIELKGRGRLKYDKARRTIVSNKQEFCIHIEETRHFEFKVWATDRDTALAAATKIWREAPTTGQWEQSETDTNYHAAPIFK